MRKLRLPIVNEAELLDRPDSGKLARHRRTYDPISPEAFDAIVAEAIHCQNYPWAVCARFLWQTMGRISDAFWLRWEDLDLVAGRVNIRWPKAGAPKPKVLFPDLCEDLRSLRALERAGPSDAVFRPGLPRPTEPKDQRTPRQAFRQWFHRGLTRYAKASGHRQRVWPHQIRGSAATALAKEGANRLAIQTQGGWASEQGLRPYLKVVAEDYRDELGVLDR
ncbi:MAG: tyrosine-type recombinase/integrase [Thermoplasmata archaeon]